MTSDVSAVVAAVQLIDVRLMDAGIKTTIRDVNAIPNADLTTNHGTKVINRYDDGFIVRAILDARVYSEEKQQAPETAPIKIFVAFALTYSLPNAASFADEALAEFARVNGAFNAWPYFREFLQSTSARMNLPPILLPVLRFKESKSSDEKRAVPSARGGTEPRTARAPRKRSRAAH